MRNTDQKEEEEMRFNPNKNDTRFKVCEFKSQSFRRGTSNSISDQKIGRTRTWIMMRLTFVGTLNVVENDPFLLRSLILQSVLLLLSYVGGERGNGERVYKQTRALLLLLPAANVKWVTLTSSSTSSSSSSFLLWFDDTLARCGGKSGWRIGPLSLSLLSLLRILF